MLRKGWGRTGTSFLVRYLTELGLDTHISRRGKHAFWDEAANAVFEDLALSTAPEALPYVVKSPWLYEYIGELIARKAVRINVVIIPGRDLVDAATSRSLVELRAVHHAVPWINLRLPPFWGITWHQLLARLPRPGKQWRRSTIWQAIGQRSGFSIPKSVKA